MFNNGFKETIEQAATLPDVDTRVFALFLEWVYRGTFHQSVKADTHSSLVIRLYSWAERICLPVLMDYAVTVLFSAFKKHNKQFNIVGIRSIYKSTPPTSLLRKWATQTLRRHIYFQDDNNGAEALTGLLTEQKDATLDLLLYMHGNVDKIADPLTLPVCTFHTHAKDDPCPFPVNLEWV